jgi:type III secretion protein L
MSNFIKIKPLETDLKSGERVIKAHDYAYFIKAQTLAKEIEIEKKQNDLAATQALLKAVQNGILQGAEESRKQLSEQMLKVSSDTVAQLAKVERDLLDVVISAVRKIIDDYDNNELALAMVRNGLKLVCKSQRVIVRVNPDKMDQLMQGLQTLSHNIDFLEIMPDKDLAIGDCVLESDLGIVRASLEEQLQHIEKSIKSALPV